MEKQEAVGPMGRHIVFLSTILLACLVSQGLLYVIDRTVMDIEAQEIELIPVIKR